MKKYILAAGLAFGSVGIIATTTQSCMTIATTVGLSVLKKILIGGVSKGLGIFKDKNSFLGNELINAALPQQLKDINSTLEKLGLSNLVQKEKGYIADAAAFIAPIAEPILINAINDMNTQIASAAEEQNSVVEDINRNLTSINDIAVQTSAGAEQTAMTSQELARLAELLQHQVQSFRM